MTKVSEFTRQWTADGYFLVAYLLFCSGFVFLSSSGGHSTIYALLVVAPFLAVVRREHFGFLRESGLLTLILVLLVYFWASVAWGEGGDIDDYRRYGWRAFMVLVFVWVTVRLALNYDRFVWWVVLVVAGSVFLSSLVALQAYGVGSLFDLRRLSGLGRVSNPNQFGALLGFSVILIAGCLIGWTRGRVWTAVLWIVGGTLLAAAVLTQGRGTLVGLLCGLSLMFVLTRRWMALLGIALLGALVLWLFGGGGLEARGFLDRTSAIEMRLELWKAGLALIKEAPVFGHGMAFSQSYQVGSYQTGSVHNLYIGIAVVGGLVGAALLVGSLLYGMWVAVREKSPISPLVVGLIGFSMVYYMVEFEHIVRYPALSWLLIWFPLALAVSVEIRARRAKAAVQS
ncbi:O-antigen polymerase [Thioalkalivibrio sp. K90mix]|uniref:O-antigen ligase family protein n=1 Tax=Thioalkalivibrio sp. (strain K90mix) TaxID=396595 RepID=UPI000195A966|nr:O-antigen ligase family protein [Thioalkalivibrio sp. K90mix]ADC70829.1 O-antigen polymerase [Thioalkalivibrio sp. K90mix]